MEGEKRFLAALALTLVFLYVWFEFFAPKPPKPADTKGAEATRTVSPSPAAEPVKEAVEARKVPAVAAEPPKLAEQDTPLYAVTWTNQPGSPAGMVLKDYRTKAEKSAPPVRVIPFQGEAPPPLRWTFEAGGKRWSDEEASYKEAAAEAGGIAYERALEKTLDVRKSFAWDPATYNLDQTVTVANRGKEPIKLKATVALSSGEEEVRQGALAFLGARTQPLRVSAFINEKTLFWTTGEILKQAKVPPGEIRWAGFDSQYFLMTAVPVEGKWSEIALEAVPKNDPAKGTAVDSATVSMVYPPYEVAAGTSQTYRLRLFVGPKDIGLLKEAGASLDRAIDLGDWLGWIARPMLFFLRWVYSILPNYGVAIILLTVLVRLLMFPLAQKQAHSMKRMTEHKPQMDALKEKYKDDKEAHSRELMSYMRTHKINPMGGCLLILPQLPIFFALYRVLWNSIELRHAPFAFWIRDLSAHDPFFVLPVLMGISMWLQQKMTPTPGGDPAQQTMMKIMPVMFTAMMIFLPAGLNLYIFVSTLWGVAQQYWVQRQISPAANVAEKVSRR